MDIQVPSSNRHVGLILCSISQGWCLSSKLFPVQGAILDIPYPNQGTKCLFFPHPQRGTKCLFFPVMCSHISGFAACFNPHNITVTIQCIQVTWKRHVLARLLCKSYKQRAWSSYFDSFGGHKRYLYLLAKFNVLVL